MKLAYRTWMWAAGLSLMCLAAPSWAQTATGQLSNPNQSYILDGMVGQINGKPVYVHDVLQPTHEQLRRLGATMPRAEFERQARESIALRIREIVFDTLVLGEAERSLSQGERMGLRYTLRKREEELLRQYGQRSRALADRTAIERTGKDIGQLLEEVRQRLVIENYLRQQLYPRINVTARDIERHYHNNPEIYNPPAGRLLRVIRCETEAHAIAIDTLLDEGMPFAEAASSDMNTYRPDEGGRFPPDRSRGEVVFGGIPPLNDAMLELKPGQYSKRIEHNGEFWWVFLESISTGERKSIDEVQSEIRDLLTRRQFNILTSQYQQRLLEEGSYNPLPEMTEAVVQVAMDRYALPE